MMNLSIKSSFFLYKILFVKKIKYDIIYHIFGGSMNIENYVFGEVYEKKIPHKDAREFAEVFGEGSLELTDLIEFCILNDLDTYACCKGHPERSMFDTNIEYPKAYKRRFFSFISEDGYVGFRLNKDYKNNGDFSYFLAELPTKINNLVVEISFNTFTKERSICLRIPAFDDGETGPLFKEIHNELQEYVNLKKENKNYECKNKIIKDIVDKTFSHTRDVWMLIENKEIVLCKFGNYKNTNFKIIGVYPFKDEPIIAKKYLKSR